MLFSTFKKHFWFLSKKFSGQMNQISASVSELSLCAQEIFADYKQPFAITYLGASLMVIYIPLAFLKDFIYKLLRRHSGSSSRASKVASKSSFGGSAPLKSGEFEKMLEMEPQKTVVIDFTDVDLPVLEEAKPLICGIGEFGDDVLKEQQLSTKEIAIYGLYLCPIWFVTEVTFQLSACLFD
jgi:solute carrier family 35 protein F5